MTLNYVQVAVNVPTRSGVFDYSIPGELVGRVGTGHLVIIPFGKQVIQGVVLRIIEQPAVQETREVIELVDAQPVLSSTQIALAEWMAESTLSPLASIIDLFLPSGLSQHADVLYELRGDDRVKDMVRPSKSPVAGRLLNLLLNRGSLRGRQIDRHFNKVQWRTSALSLIRQGWLTSRSVLPAPRVHPKSIRTAQLAVPPDQALSAMHSLGQKSTLGRRQKALNLLIQKPEEINVSWVYAESGCNLADLQALEERELIALRETEVWRDPLESARYTSQPAFQPIVLTDEQEAVWARIQDGFNQLAAGERIKPYLVEGITGSGKTELYLLAAQEAIRRGKQAIILVPEISLTPQTVKRFLNRFPGQVGLVHSRLSDGERYDTWRRARNGALNVIIGPRSALFTYLPDPGLIVLDECHDPAYDQSDPPFYHAAAAAQYFSQLAGAICIMGSATPTIQQRYEARAGSMVGLKLTRRINRSKVGDKESSLPRVDVLDMREELKAGNRSIFSRVLQEKLEATLANHEQAILFINRRGTATYIFCRECGYILKCPRCESPLTLHLTDREELICHHCGYKRKMPDTCPHCGSKSIRAYGLGSEKVEGEVQALFPNARTLRWDWETTRQKDSHETILAHFSAHRADVLVGTQMLAKGLDLPLVTLVGVILADVGLNLPDPFASERVFQVLTHVAGRAGRGGQEGRVIFQTYQPEHYAIQAASRHDVTGFYKRELAEREKLGYPPFVKLVRCEFRNFDPLKAENEARELGVRLTKLIHDQNRLETSIIGPVPCFHPKLNGLYRWQIVLRGPDPVSLIKNHFQDGWRVEVDPISLL
jgi:primosomal protein N' (replication factor Y)